MANWIPESADGDSENRREYTQKPLYMMTEIQKIGENILITQQGWEFAHSLIAHSLICSFCSNQMSNWAPYEG